MLIKTILEQLISGQNLTAKEMQEMMHACMTNTLTEAQMAAFLVAMRIKSESIEELTEAAKVLMHFCRPLDLVEDCIDIVGTGGDGKNTFNISTAAAFVIAASGVKVAKHGSVSVSSKSGAADVLEAAQIPLQPNDATLKACIQNVNLCFLYGPFFHQALQYLKKVRQELGIRSFFNLLGPLINPAKVKRQVVGVCDEKWQVPLAQVLKNLGSERAFVIRSQDGLDEASIASITKVVELHQGNLTAWEINPKEYNLFHPNLDAILVDSPEQSLEIILNVFKGNKGPARDIVILNAALALYCAQSTSNFKDAVEKATQTLDTGKALHTFEQFKKWVKS